MKKKKIGSKDKKKNRYVQNGGKKKKYQANEKKTNSVMPAVRPPTPKHYHKRFEDLGINEMMDSTKRVGFLRVTKAKLIKRIEEKADDGDAYRKLGFILHEQNKFLDAIEKLQKGNH